MWNFKNIWFQLHWLVGITAGTVLMVIGLSGALYSFHEEVLDWLNPGTASVPPRQAPALTPPELVGAVQASGEQRRIERITVFAKPGRSALASFAPGPGQRRGETVFLDPYTGARLPQQRGQAFFEWVEHLHRWLLLPRDDGKPITGTLSLCLLGLSLSGLYLRWPAKPLSWRTWLTFNVRRQGRPFLWGLHSVAGTWALVVYLMFTLTGAYWAFNAVRAPVDRWLGAPSRAAARAENSAAQQAARQSPPPPLGAAALEPAWAGFARQAPGWQFAQLRLPQRAGQPLQFSWFDATAPHERARNQLSLGLDGAVQRDERFADLPAGRRALLAIYPLHLGSYFGLAGRIIVTVAALMLPLFAITGWMLYLDRRRKARAAAHAQQALADGAGAGHGDDPGQAIAVVHASQSGHAQQLAARTAARLRGAGLAAQLVPAATLDMEQLQRHARVLWVASTFGEGQPPDAARRFARLLRQAAEQEIEQGTEQGQGKPLAGQRFGLLALGDRQYAQFCGFGLALAAQLQQLGAQPLFPTIAMDGEDDAAWQAWSAALGRHWGTAGLQELHAAGGGSAAEPEAAFHRGRLKSRLHCNPGSVGRPLYQIELDLPAPPFPAPHWQAGALVEIWPQHAAQAVDAWLRARQLDGAAPVRWHGASVPLRDALAASELPEDASWPAPQALAEQLQPLPARSYSLASLPQDGHLRLCVRQMLVETPGQPARLGLASGWLSEHAPLGGTVLLRLVENPSFAPHDNPALPAIFLGNGSGYAGLRGHLLDRIAKGRNDNWLIFGERQRAHDGYAEAEARQWLAQGHLRRADFVYSRDPQAQGGSAPQLRYVQHVVRAQAGAMREWLERGAVLYLCGSFQGMASDVDAVLTEMLGAAAMEELAASGRYRRDVY